MTDCHSIVFLDNQNLGIDTKISFLSGMVPKLLDIEYFCNVFYVGGSVRRLNHVYMPDVGHKHATQMT